MPVSGLCWTARLCFTGSSVSPQPLIHGICVPNACWGPLPQCGANTCCPTASAVLADNVLGRMWVSVVFDGHCRPNQAVQDVSLPQGVDFIPGLQHLLLDSI